MALVQLDKAGQPLCYAQTDSQERLGVHNLLHVQDQKAQGTNGGTFTAGAWRTRDLNTVLTNTISGASLASNQITLPAGTYFIEARAPACYVYGHKAKLYNVSDSADIIAGKCGLCQNSGPVVNTDSIISGIFTLAAQKIVAILHTTGGTSRTTDGFGGGVGIGTEVYTDVKIWKVA